MARVEPFLSGCGQFHARLAYTMALGCSIVHRFDSVTPEVPPAMTRAMSGAWQVSIEQSGKEGEPIVTIDGFVPDPLAMRDDAAMLAYAPMGVHYPGIRAVIPRVVATRLALAVTSLAHDVFGAARLGVADAFYSIVTTEPAALTPIQRLPHFDGVEPERLALLHYLSPDSPGGTAFYRHRSTGFETITADRLPVYRATLEGELADTGLPEPAYIAGDTSLFEQIAIIEGRFNRAVLYRGNRLHCAWLPDGTPFIADPARGRLTSNLFLEAVA